MSQELRKSLTFHTICCNSSLLQLQIIPPSTAESDNLDKQPIASCLGLEPDTLKRFSPSSAFLHHWKDLTNWTQYFQDLSSCLYQWIVKGSRGGWKISQFTSARVTLDEPTDKARKGFWIFISLYIYFMASTARQQLYLFALFLLKNISLNTEVAIPPCPSSPSIVLKLESISKQSTSIPIHNKSSILCPCKS